MHWGLGGLRHLTDCDRVAIYLPNRVTCRTGACRQNALVLGVTSKCGSFWPPSKNRPTDRHNRHTRTSKSEEYETSRYPNRCAKHAAGPYGRAFWCWSAQRGLRGRLDPAGCGRAHVQSRQISMFAIDPLVSITPCA
eukprot:3887575-Prymnesium_polylepis.1